jgi:hypothetical protein
MVPLCTSQGTAKTVETCCWNDTLLALLAPLSLIQGVKNKPMPSLNLSSSTDPGAGITASSLQVGHASLASAMPNARRKGI